MTSLVSHLHDLRTLIRAIALTLVCALPSAGSSKEWKDIRFASEGARPPYNFLDSESQLDGFEIELAREICARLKARCTFVQQDWETLVPNLMAGQYDAIIAAMEITPARQAKLIFSQPYLRMPSAFVSVRQREIRGTGAADLAGRSIGVPSDTPQQAYLEEHYPKSNIRPYDGIDAAILDLAEGRIDLVFGEKEGLAHFLKTRREARCCKLLADAHRDPAIFGEGFGIGLRPGDRELKALIDDALAQITGDGTYARIAAKYFDFDVR